MRCHSEERGARAQGGGARGHRAQESGAIDNWLERGAVSEGRAECHMDGRGVRSLRGAGCIAQGSGVREQSVRVHDERAAVSAGRAELLFPLHLSSSDGQGSSVLFCRAELLCPFLASMGGAVPGGAVPGGRPEARERTSGKGKGARLRQR